MSRTAPARGSAATSTGEHQIGLVSCLAFSVGTMIGGGVFALSGIVVDKAGPGAIAAYVAAAVIMLFSALCFAAVASRAAPGDTGYGPIGVELGAVWRFTAMWAFYLSGITLMAFVLLSFGTYLQEYFISGLPALGAALLAVGALVLLNLGPADLVGRAETVLVALKLAILVLMIGFGIAAVAPEDFTPFLPGGTASLVSATALLFTAYTGFNVVTNMANTVRNPTRTVPLAIVLSIGIVAVVYVGVMVAMLASGEKDFGSAGLAKAAGGLMGSWGAHLVAFAACISTLSGANANLMGASELMIGMAAKGDVPAAAARMTRRGHPLVSVVFAGVVGASLLFADDPTFIVSLSNVTAIFAMVVVDVAAFRLGARGWPSPGMRLPGRVLVPVLAVLAAASQLPSLGLANVGYCLVAMLVGLLLYARRRGPGSPAVMRAAQDRLRALDTPLRRAMRSRVRRATTDTVAPNGR